MLSGIKMVWVLEASGRRVYIFVFLHFFGRNILNVDGGTPTTMTHGSTMLVGEASSQKKQIWSCTDTNEARGLELELQAFRKPLS